MDTFVDVRVSFSMVRALISEKLHRGEYSIFVRSCDNKERDVNTHIVMRMYERMKDYGSQAVVLNEELVAGKDITNLGMFVDTRRLLDDACEALNIDVDKSSLVVGFSVG